MILRPVLLAALAVPLFSFGCRKQSVETYRIPKETDAPMPLLGSASTAPAQSGGTESASPASALNSMAGTPVATAEGAALTWSAPPEWKQKSASSMRKGSYAVPGEGAADGDLAITAFPGDVGGELANVNRWRGQVQLQPIAESELSSHIERREHNGLRFAIVDIVGTGQPPQRILGAAVPLGNATWFFKLSGPVDVVEKAKPAFLKFLQTVKPAAPATQ